MLFGPEDEPGRLRLLSLLFKHPGNVLSFRESLRPSTCGAFSHGRHGGAQRRVPGGHSAHAKSLAQVGRGTAGQSPGPVLTVALRIRRAAYPATASGFQKFMQAHAETHRMSAHRACAAACEQLHRRNLRQTPAPTGSGFIRPFVGWIFERYFDGVTMNLDGLAAVKRMALRGPVVYVPCHKSHVDYLILSYMLYQPRPAVPPPSPPEEPLLLADGAALPPRGRLFHPQKLSRRLPLTRGCSRSTCTRSSKRAIPSSNSSKAGASRTGKLLMRQAGAALAFC